MRLEKVSEEKEDRLMMSAMGMAGRSRAVFAQSSWVEVVPRGARASGLSATAQEFCDRGKSLGCTFVCMCIYILYVSMYVYLYEYILAYT